jgi:predicted site-specific integrase-resolvase
MLLKARKIAEKYKIHHDSLLKWERDGQLQSKRTAGGHRRWLEQDIEELLKIGKVKEEKKYAWYVRCSTAKQKEVLFVWKNKKELLLKMSFSKNVEPVFPTKLGAA